MNGSGAFFLLVVKRRLLRVGCTPRANPLLRQHRYNQYILIFSDILTVINAPLVVVLNIIESLPDFEVLGLTVKGFLYNYISENVLESQADFKDDLFHDYGVDDILWSGYTPGIMNFIFNITEESDAEHCSTIDEYHQQNGYPNHGVQRLE